jgi:deoxycytidylate deaminase
MNFSDMLSSIAMKSNQRAKYAALIIHRNKIIGIGYNHLINNNTNITRCLLRNLQT